MTFAAKLSSRKGILTALVCLAIVLINFVIQIGTNKTYQGMGVDSGVFAYCGQQILDGHLLYRDCYDNKPPAVYYLNAAAQLFLPPVPGSFWLFQAVWMAITGVIFYLIMKWVWGGVPALLSTAIFLFTALYPPYYQNGNHTEGYVLLPIILIIGALYGFLSTGQRRYLAGIGLLTAFTFLLKPTYISIGGAAALVALYVDLRCAPWQRAIRRVGLDAALMLASLLAPLLLVAAYWAAGGGLYDLLFAVFLHNRQYVSDGFGWWLVKETFLKVLLAQPSEFLFGLSLASGMVLLVEMRRDLLPRWGKAVFDDGASTQLEPVQARRWLTLAVLISIPFEIFFIALSGRNFGHYYLLPIPAMAASSAYLFWMILSGPRPRPAVTLVAAAALIVLAIPWGYDLYHKEKLHPGDIQEYFQNPGITSYRLSELEQYIADHSQPSDSVLVWSTHPSLNLVTRRHSPTRYVFALHVLKPTPAGNTGFPDLIGELQKDPPELIAALRASSVGLPDFWSDESSLCPDCSAEARQGLVDLKRYIDGHYDFAIQIWDWYLYRRKAIEG